MTSRRFETRQVSSRRFALTPLRLVWLGLALLGAAVAREAGVSPAAPYHHFKDKSDLLEAVAHEGWDLLNDQMTKARASQTSVRDKLTSLGVAYVRFAHDEPAVLVHRRPSLVVESARQRGRGGIEIDVRTPQLAGRHGEQRTKGGRVEVHLYADLRAVVMDGHRFQVHPAQTALEGPHARAARFAQIQAVAEVDDERDGRRR